MTQRFIITGKKGLFQVRSNYRWINYQDALQERQEILSSQKQSKNLSDLSADDLEGLIVWNSGFREDGIDAEKTLQKIKTRLQEEKQ